MDFSGTRFSFGRPLTDYGKVQRLVAPLLRGRRGQVRRALRSGKQLLNVGCGPNLAPGFINLDYAWRPGLDVCWDLAAGVPLPDCSMVGAYSEHCLEHLEIDMARRVLDELHRVLQPGATLRLVVPDAELYLDLYQQAKHAPADFPYVADKVRAGEITPMMAVNAIFREHGHLYAYDFETLSRLVRQAGFEKVERARFMQGRDAALLIDTPHRAVESLYLEASRPS